MKLKVKLNNYRVEEIERDDKSPSWIEKHQEGNQNKLPPIPYWMHHFVNGQIAGEPIKKGMEIIHPSGQQWQLLKNNERAELLELVEFNGQDASDFVRGMEVQYPRTPRGK